MVDLKLDGYTLREVAEQTRWSFECVRKWWRRVSVSGEFTLADQRYGLSKAWVGQDVRITFDADKALGVRD